MNNNFRPIFKPVNTRVLSPAAAYDLSREFTRPIRVFGKLFFLTLSFFSANVITTRTEPEVSKYTTNKRKSQYSLFLIGFFFISLLGLICGEPTDRVYMYSLYGSRYAAIYEHLSRWSNSLIMTTLRHFLYRIALFLCTIIYYIFLFMRAVAKAIGWVFMTAVALPSRSLRRSAIILESVFVQTLDALGFVFSLQWKTWAIAIPACWMLYLEIRQMTIS